MLGYAWLLRSEAAQVLHRWGNYQHVKASVAVFRVAHAACRASIGRKHCFYPGDYPAAHALLTRYTARTEGKS